MSERQLAERYDEIPEWSFGDRLRKAREHAGLSNEQMAAAYGVSSGTISNWEKGRGHPRHGELQMAQRWADITGVAPEWLLTGFARNRWFASVPLADGQMQLALDIPPPQLSFAA